MLSPGPKFSRCSFQLMRSLLWPSIHVPEVPWVTSASQEHPISMKNPELSLTVFQPRPHWPCGEALPDASSGATHVSSRILEVLKLGSCFPAPHWAPLPFSLLLPSLTALNSWRNYCKTPGKRTCMPVSRFDQCTCHAQVVAAVSALLFVEPQLVTGRLKSHALRGRAGPAAALPLAAKTCTVLVVVSVQRVSFQSPAILQGR